MKEKVIVVLPAYNEEVHIGWVLEEIKRICGSVKVYVIDDCSTDDTADIAHQYGASVSILSKHIGVGGATRYGLEKAICNGADIIVFLDSDGQHDPKYIPKFVSAIRSGADMAVGCRDLSEYPIFEKVGNRGLSALAGMITPSGIKDTECGYRALSLKAAKKLDLRAKGYEICADFVYNAHKNKFKIKNIPMCSVFTKRKPNKFFRGVENFSYVLQKKVRSKG